MYICQSCGFNAQKWSGKCNSCNQWNTFIEEVSSVNKNTKAMPLINLQNISSAASHQRIKTGIGSFDEVLGGGLVPGSIVLIGGDPGIGKSTLLIQLADKIQNSIYVSAEESAEQLAMRAKRLGIKNNIQILMAIEVDIIAESIRQSVGAKLIVIDSIQTIYDASLPASPGTVGQVRCCLTKLVRIAKEKNIILVIVSHVTKDGQIAGPKVLEHMVDTVLYFEGDSNCQYRILRSIKNRFGTTNEIAIFDMTGKGLQIIDNPSSLFLPQQSTFAISGSTIFAGIEGTKTILIEIQALLSSTYMPSPRRAVVGWDINRLAMIIAVINTRYGFFIGDKEIYLNIAGGLKIQEPAADLAVAMALISAATKVPLPKNTIVFGEIALSGEIRPVNNLEKRIKEASSLGFTKVITAKNNNKINKINFVQEIRHIKDLKKFFEIA